MCNIYGFVKGFWHNEPQIINCKLGAYGFDEKALYYIKSYAEIENKEFV